MVTVFSLRALHTVLHNALITELEIRLFLILKVLVEGFIFGNFVLNRTDDFSWMELLLFCVEKEM